MFGFESFFIDGHSLKFGLLKEDIEKQLKIGTLTKRYDIVVFESEGSIQLIVECKAKFLKLVKEGITDIVCDSLTQGF